MNFPLIGRLAALSMGFGLGMASSLHAAKDLKSGEFSFVKNQVEHSRGNEKSIAKSKDLLEEASVVDTGTTALTQLDFADTSVLRLGPNTQFSFQSKERIIKLDRGSMMMNVPPGNGGITVDGGGVTGAVSGTTVMASKDSEGNFAFVVLETKGVAKVLSASGQTANLLPGQIALVRKVDGSVRVFDLNLDAVIHSSPFFNAFPTTMPGFENVTATADGQATEVKEGIKFLLAYDEVGLKAEDPEKEPLAFLFGKNFEDMVASRNTFLGEISTAAGTEEGGSGDSGGGAAVVLGAESGSGSSVSDARQPEGEEIASKSNPPSGDGAGGPGGTDTAAGGEDVSETDTAAGGGGGPDTQPPLAPSPAPPIPPVSAPSIPDDTTPA